jgi:hypothetical protein
MEVGHTPLQIPEVVEYSNTLFKNLSLGNLESVTNQQHDESWRAWLTASSFNTVVGLENLPHSAFIPGTTDAFGEFVARYPHRRIRASRSDFILTKILCKSWSRQFLSLEDAPLDENDALVISMPFSGNGGVYPENLLAQAEKLDIPVMIDAAYYGNSQGVIYDLRYDCIKDFAVSLSKCLAPNQLRLGIRFTRDNVDDGATAGLLGADIFDRFGCYMSMQLLKAYSHDFVVKTVKPVSDQVCKQLGLTPTNTMTLALGSESLREQFQRGDYIRVCITNEIVGNLS